MKNQKTSFLWSTAVILLIPFIISCSGKKSGSEEQNSQAMSEESQETGWIDLFDGQTLNGWKQYNKDTIGAIWSVQDGAIVCAGEGHGEGSGEQGGSLITRESFGNFELTLDWKISPGGNSGILYHVVESPEYGHAYETGPEYQLIDDKGWEGDLKDAQMTGSNYDMYAAPKDKKMNPPGEWNSSRIIYNNGHVEQYLNGQKVVEFDEGSADWQARYENSKWTEYPGWCKYKEGAIGLQDHGSPIYFRNIKIRRL